MNAEPASFVTSSKASRKIGPLASYLEAVELIRSDYWTFWLLTMLASLIGHAFKLVLMGPSICGMFCVYFAKRRKETIDASVLFQGFHWFQASLIGNLLCSLLQFLLYLPVIGLMIVLAVTSGYGFSQQQWFGSTLLILGMIPCLFSFFFFNSLINTLQFFTCGLIVDRELDGFTAFKTAFKALWQNKWELLIHNLIETLLTLLAASCFMIPIIFVMPIIMAAEFTAFEKVFPSQRQKLPQQDLPRDMDTQPPAS